MPTIRHTHVRRLDAPIARVSPLIDRLWSGGPLDAFPHDRIRPFRDDPDGAAGFVAGASRFGHGPFRFFVEEWDGVVFRARVENAGYDGFHGFHLRADGDRTVATHDLDARLALAPWLAWRAVVGRIHDWAVQSLFDRLEVILRDGHAPARTAATPPWQFRVYNRARARVRARAIAA